MTINTNVRTGFVIARLRSQFSPDKPMLVTAEQFERIKADGTYADVMDRIAVRSAPIGKSSR